MGFGHHGTFENWDYPLLESGFDVFERRVKLGATVIAT
jgi:hypothetical protein